MLTAGGELHAPSSRGDSVTGGVARWAEGSCRRRQVGVLPPSFSQVWGREGEGTGQDPRGGTISIWSATRGRRSWAPRLSSLLGASCEWGAKDTHGEHRVREEKKTRTVFIFSLRDGMGVIFFASPERNAMKSGGWPAFGLHSENHLRWEIWAIWKIRLVQIVAAKTWI
jgi:hypothetical protein